MRRDFVLFGVLSLVVIIAGCTSQGGGKPIIYSNNIVTIENYGVLTTNPYPGSSTSISFWVKNNGDKPVTVTVDFFNVPGNLNAALSTCNGKTEGLVCKGIRLEPFDVRPVKLDLTVPSDNILSPVPYVIAYSISYDWTGYRSATVPMIDGITRTRPTSQFSQSQPSYGPVSVDILPPVGRTYKQDNQVITERWGLVGRPFEVVMNFKQASSPQGTIAQPLVIPTGQIKLDSMNVEPANQLGQSVYCAFNNSVYPKPLEVPGEIACNFLSSGQAVSGELDGVVSLNYTYTYSFTRTETIIEQPAPQ